MIKAVGFAAQAHAAQKRKYTGEPYINHCVAVASKVAEYTDNIGVVVAAVLHDTIEDTPVIADDIEKEFGVVVRRLVLEVTDVSNPKDGNRAFRKKKDREHLAKCSIYGATIKLADLYDNTKTIVQHDQDFAKVYVKEKAMIMPLLMHGPRQLWHEVDQQLGDAINFLIKQGAW